MTDTLRGATAVITGASSGIGAATAQAMAAHGATVVLFARRKSRLDDLSDKINDAGAGTAPAAMVAVNLNGGLSTTHAALPHLTRAAQGERGVADIVTISSIAGRKVPDANSNVYAATKHAVGAFSEALRQELADRHVRVGVVEPGVVATELTTSGDPNAPDARDPSGLGVLDPTDVADAIIFMVSRPRHAAVNEVLIRPTEQVI